MKFFCDPCDASYPDYELGATDTCPECFGVVTAIEEPPLMPLPSWVTAQPAFTPSYAVTEHAERYATDGRYGGYVGVEVKPSSGVWRLEEEEIV